MKLPGERAILGEGLGRFKPLTMPAVTVKRKPKDCEASTVWPGRSAVEFPQGVGKNWFRPFDYGEVREGSAPISLACMIGDPSA